MATVQAAPQAATIGAALHATLWAMRNHNTRALTGAGITGTQAGVLWFLHEYKSLSLGRLAALQGTTPANITGIVRRLERDGLVRRARHPSDSRVQLIELTPEGLSRTKQARKALERSMAQLFEGASSADLAGTLRVLEHVRRRAEADDAGEP